MFNTWLWSEYYSYGFLVLPIAAFFTWIKREQLKIRKPSRTGIPLLVSGIPLYVLGFEFGSRVLGAASLLSVIVGLVLIVYGTNAVRTLAFPLAFLVFMVPLPFIQDLTYRLQAMTVRSSSWALGAFGLPVSTLGAEITLKNGPTFTVGLICSGIDSLLALMALAAVYARILERSVPKRASLFVLAIPISFVGNTLRVTSIIVVASFINVGVATGWYHDVSSPLFFAIDFLLLILVGWILRLRINYGIVGKPSV
jgi:exosortase